MAIKLFILTLLSFEAFTFTGVISVLEAPIFKEETTTSQIISYYRKGKKLFIPNQVMNRNFLKIPTNDGSSGYIQRRHIYIYDLPLNLQQRINKDSTDYREENPIREKWFNETTSYKQHYELNLNFILTPFRPFGIPQNINSSNESPPLGFSFNWFKHLHKDKNTYFFGLGLGVDSQELDIQAGPISYTQTNSRVSFQTKIGYQILKTEKSSLNIFLGLNWHPLYSIEIQQDNSSFTLDGRPFSSQIDLGYYLPDLFSKWGINIYSRVNFLLGSIDSSSDETQAIFNQNTFTPQRAADIRIGFSFARFF